ncbi:MAG: hypothetical protein RI983_1644 [Bacteroidota bacterium]|jgi:hypothetical protein
MILLLYERKRGVHERNGGIRVIGGIRIQKKKNFTLLLNSILIIH